MGPRKPFAVGESNVYFHWRKQCFGEIKPNTLQNTEFLYFRRTMLLDRLWNDLSSASSSRPVQDSFAVQEHERRRDLCGVETCSGLFKLSGLLDVEHEITAVYKLHHKEETVLQKCRKEKMTFPHDRPKHNNLREPGVIKRPKNP